MVSPCPVSLTQDPRKTTNSSGRKSTDDGPLTRHGLSRLYGVIKSLSEPEYLEGPTYSRSRDDLKEERVPEFPKGN